MLPPATLRPVALPVTWTWMVVWVAVAWEEGGALGVVGSLRVVGAGV